MKNNKGITMLILVFMVIILLIIAGVALRYAVGKKGAFVLASEESFRFDMQQIKEAVDREQTQYDLEEEKSSYAFTKNKEAQILEKYLDKMSVRAFYVKQQKRLILTVYYDPTKFTPEQQSIMQSLGFVEQVFEPGDDTNTTNTVIHGGNTTGNTVGNTVYVVNQVGQ